MKPGIHLANGGFHALNTDVDWGAFTVLHHNRDQIPAIRARYPNAPILVRHYLDNWVKSDAVTVAREIGAWYPSVREHTRHITYANEQNLSNEGYNYIGTYPPANLYETIAQWNDLVLVELRRLIPDAIIHFPAFSQGHSDDQDDAGYVGFDICRDVVLAHDVLDVHTYWNGAANRKDVFYGRRYEKLHKLFPRMPLFISECGSDVSYRNDDGVDVAAWVREVPDYISGVTFFIWDSDAANVGWALWNKPNIIRAFQDYIEPPSPPPAVQLPPPVPPVVITLQQVVVFAAEAHKPWMPINTDGALYKFALKKKLGYPQTDEYTFWFGDQSYVGQVYNAGIVYCRKGLWDRCEWTKKPPEDKVD